MRTTVSTLAQRLTSEAAAWEYLEGLRWPNGPICPTCNGSDVYLIVPKNGVSRRTVSGSMSERRTWACRPCRRQFSATTGTMMHGTRLPIRIWVLVIFEMCASKNGVSACEIERKYGICARSAWFLMHRIREAMRPGGFVQSMRGMIVADETWIGGDPKNRHGHRSHMVTGAPSTTKVPVAALIEAETGEVRSRVIPKVDSTTLHKFLGEHVNMSASTLHTDESMSYVPIGRWFASHQSVNHSNGEYVRSGVSTNKLENYFSQLKRSLDGTYHHVSVEHLGRYLSEFDYRFTTRQLTDGDRMADLMRRAEGRRITYKRVTGAGWHRTSKSVRRSGSL